MKSLKSKRNIEKWERIEVYVLQDLLDVIYQPRQSSSRITQIFVKDINGKHDELVKSMSITINDEWLKKERGFGYGRITTKTKSREDGVGYSKNYKTELDFVKALERIIKTHRKFQLLAFFT